MSHANLKKYHRLKSLIAEEEKNLALKEALLAREMDTLKKQFGCSTLQEAKDRLNRLEQKRDALEQKFSAALEEFEKKWEGDGS